MKSWLDSCRNLRIDVNSYLFNLGMGRHENLPTLTVVVDTNVQTTLKPNSNQVLSRLVMWLPWHNEVMQLSKTVVDDVCDFAQVDQHCVRLATLKDQARLRNEVRSRLDRTIKAASAGEQEAANILLAERMRIIFLLNTLGGWVDASDKLIQLATKVRKNGGEVWAYGRDKVKSSGSMIFMAADTNRRVLVNGTDLFFHLSTYARYHSDHTRSKQLIENSRRNEIAELRTLFTTNSVHRDYARYLARSVDSVDAQTPFGEDATWTISDLEAEQFWHVRRRGLQRAQASYTANIGGENIARSLLKQPGAKAVRKFFR